MIVRSKFPALLLFPWLVCCNIFFQTNVAGQDFSGQNAGGEFATFDTPQFAEGDSHRQDLCGRYLALNNGTIKLEDVLRGVKLNVVFGAYAGSYFNYNNETGIQPYGGIVAEIMDELSARAGFTWRDSFGIYDVPAGGENQTWTDLLIWSIDNYDLTVDWWAKNLDRMNLGVAFLKEWYDSSIIMISKTDPAAELGIDDTKVSLGNWLDPFTWSVWYATIGTIFLSGVVYQLIEWLSNDRRDRKFWAWFSDSLYLSSMNATQAYEYGTPRTAAAKIFGFSSALWGLILTASYTANLASLLVTTGDVNPVNTVGSIEDVTYLKYPVCTWAGTILDSHLEANHASTIRKPQLQLVDVYNALNSNECLFAVDTVQGWLEHKAKRDYNPLCKLKWVGGDRKVASIGAGFVAKADSGYLCTNVVRDVIDFYMEQLVTEGFIERAWETENKRKQDLDCDTFRPDLLADFGDFEDGGECGGRRRRRLHEQRLLQEVFQTADPDTQRRRRMKAATKAAASASGALSEGEPDGQQMEFGALVGSFLVHWILMVVALLVAAGQRYRKQRKYAAMNTSTAKMFGGDSSDGFEVDHANASSRTTSSPKVTAKMFGGYSSDGVELDASSRTTSNSKLQQQIRVLSDALKDSNNSQTRLMEEQGDLRAKIERLTIVLEKVIRAQGKDHSQSSLHDL